MREKLDSALAFLNTGIWLLPEKGLSRSKAVSIRALKILLLAIRGYQRDQCAMKASALTFYSVLSVVPVIASVARTAPAAPTDDTTAEAPGTSVERRCRSASVPSAKTRP